MLRHLQRAFSDNGNNIRLLCQFVRVGYDHNALVLFVGTGFEYPRNILRCILIQIVAKLIRKNHRGFACQRPDNGHALLAGSLVLV